MKHFSAMDYHRFQEIKTWIAILTESDFTKQELIEMLAFQIVDNEIEDEHNNIIENIYDKLKKQ